MRGGYCMPRWDSLLLQAKEVPCNRAPHWKLLFYSATSETLWSPDLDVFLRLFSMWYLFPLVLRSRVAAKIFLNTPRYNSESILPLILKTKVRGPWGSQHLLPSKLQLSREGKLHRTCLHKGVWGTGLMMWTQVPIAHLGNDLLRLTTHVYASPRLLLKRQG